MTTEKSRADRRALMMLAIGGLGGVILGAGAALRQRAIDARAMPADAIAAVNGKVIRQAEYARVLEAMASDRRGELSESDHKLALDRLIEQELLIQRGIALGTVESDRAVRGTIVREMLMSITADSASEQPSEDQLRAFYAANRVEFAGAVAPVSQSASQSSGVSPSPPGDSGFDRMRPEIEEEYRHRLEDKTLRDYIAWLRARAKIVTARELPR